MNPHAPLRSDRGAVRLRFDGGLGILALMAIAIAITAIFQLQPGSTFKQEPDVSPVAAWYRDAAPLEFSTIRIGLELSTNDAIRIENANPKGLERMDIMYNLMSVYAIQIAQESTFPPRWERVRAGLLTAAESLRVWGPHVDQLFRHCSIHDPGVDQDKTIRCDDARAETYAAAYISEFRALRDSEQDAAALDDRIAPDFAYSGCWALGFSSWLYREGYDFRDPETLEARPCTGPYDPD